MKYLLFIFFLLSLFFNVASTDDNTANPNKDLKQQPVSAILKELGDRSIKHYPDFSLENVSIENGEALFHSGFASKTKGGKTARQSKHFVCTSCHNVVKEEPDLSNPNAQDRLRYAAQKGIPFLQGTTMHGVINRTQFYNGDYYKKYGELVTRARNNIFEAIQLCAVECAQGRKLKNWELQSILAYLWTLELRVGDLELTDAEKTSIQQALDGNFPTDSAVVLLKSKYPQNSPATFIPPPEDRAKGEDLVGNPENGKLVYDLSCKHCHENSRYSFFALDDAKTTFRYLKKHIAKYNRYSMYQVIRWGTSPIPGKGAYMPNYTEERMSKQQLEDLRAYIEQQAL